MRFKTHLVFGSAISLALTNPNDPKVFLASLAGGLIGSSLPDIDSSKSESNQILDKVIIGCTLIITISILVYWFSGFNLYLFIKNQTNIMPYLTSFLFCLALCFLGSFSPHRSFMHSFLAIVLFSLSLYWSLPLYFVLPFVIGMLSHIFLDLFNHKGITIFYPLKKRFCLDLCDSVGLTDNIIFSLSTTTLIIELIFFISTLING